MACLATAERKELWALGIFSHDAESYSPSQVPCPQSVSLLFQRKYVDWATAFLLHRSVWFFDSTTRLLAPARHAPSEFLS